MATKTARWETRPLDCWTKAKELRREQYDNTMKAEEEKKPLIACWGASGPLAKGFEHEELIAEAYGATVAIFGDLAKESLEAVENAGFAVDLCPYPKLFWGSMLLNKSPWGAFPKPDLIVMNVGGCTTHNKFAQFVSENIGIPVFTMDSPLGPCRRFEDAQELELGKEHYTRFYMEQYQDFIKWMEENTGQRWNYERTLENLRDQRERDRLYAEIVLLNQAIPATLDTKTLHSLHVACMHSAGRKEGMEFLRSLRDEVKWRVENKIAALATERCRLVEDNIPPWYAMHILRYPNKWGATYVACPTLLMGGLDFDGQHYSIPKTLEEEGWALRTPEEGLRYMAEEALSRQMVGEQVPVKVRVARLEAAAREWKGDGAVLRINIGCTGRIGMQEAAYVLGQRGIPTMVYNCSLGDKRSWNEAQIIDRLEAFLEGTLGLDRLEE